MHYFDSIISVINSPQAQKIISVLVSEETQRKLFPAQVVFIFFAIIFFIGIIYFWVVSSYLKAKFWLDVVEFFSLKPYGFVKIMRRWKKIQNRIVTGSEPEYKLAIIEADDLLNSTLEKRGYIGKDFEEKIQKMKETQLLDPGEILGAHKIRNSIVYDPDYRLNLEEAKKILKLYKQLVQNIETF